MILLPSQRSEKEGVRGMHTAYTTGQLENAKEKAGALT
jgi:hypothetical protein